MVDDFKEMLGGRQSVYDTVRWNAYGGHLQAFGKVESSTKPHSSFAKECDRDSAVILQQLKEASRMLVP